MIKTKYKIIKRFLDISLAIIFIVMLSPFMIITCLFIWIQMGNPLFYIEERIGLNEKVFNIIKYRTMRNAKNNKETDRDRITKIGAIMRKYSIDELPQLVNILKGDMSFIGPRPLYRKYLPYYTEREKKRHDVRPGMSGLTEIKGRSLVTWDKQFEYDAYYVENISFKLDMEIFIRTIPLVLKAKNVIVDRRTDELDFISHRKSKQLVN